MKPATVLKKYKYKAGYGEVIDVIFDHHPSRVSKAHFIEGIKEYVG